jgi:hypothetical protein
MQLFERWLLTEDSDVDCLTYTARPAATASRRRFGGRMPKPLPAGQMFTIAQKLEEYRIAKATELLRHIAQNEPRLQESL